MSKRKVTKSLREPVFSGESPFQRGSIGSEKNVPSSEFEAVRLRADEGTESVKSMFYSNSLEPVALYTQKG